MPWKEICRMDEKLVFVADCLRGELPMTALCEDYGISRKTGYKWLGRYREHGPEGLVERSRAPHRHGRSMAPEMAEAIVALRRQRPHWGPRKLRAVLMGERPEAVWPAASTMGDLLRAEGLVVSRRRRRRVAAPGRPFRAVTAPNDVWCIDFKGWFRTRDGERCDPLTVSDAYSRFLLACVIVPPRTDTVRVAVEQLFKRYGLPLAIRSDNGAPFAGTGAGGLSRLSVGWIKAGIALERIEPGQPQQNGRHERMHRTLKAETAKPPAASAGRQQVRFDRFRQDFNRQPSPRGARPAAACGVLPALAAPLPRTPGRALVRCLARHAPGAHRRLHQVGRRPGLHQRNAEGRTRRHRRDRQRRLDRSLRRHRPRDHRSPDEKTSWLPRGPAGRAEAKQTTNTVTHVTGP